MKLLSQRYAKIGVMITLFMVSSKGFSACTEQDIPLGSGNISSGTSLSITVEDQEANRTGSGMGRSLTTSIQTVRQPVAVDTLT